MSAYFRKPTVLVKTVASALVPEKISETTLPCSNVILIGRKAAQTDNTSTINIGPASADGAQPIPISPGGQYALSSVDLSEWYVDVTTNGDGVVAVYW